MRNRQHFRAQQKLGILPCPLLMNPFGCRRTTGFPQPGLHSQTTTVRPQGGQPLFLLYGFPSGNHCVHSSGSSGTHRPGFLPSALSAQGTAGAWPHPEPPQHHREKGRSDGHRCKAQTPTARPEVLPARMNAFITVTRQTDLNRKVCTGMSGHPGVFAARQGR